MNFNPLIEPKVIAFNSGKGGAGKTTIAIAMASLLSSMEEFSCLLIDFDLVTNGASYFFSERIESEKLGVWELIEKAQNDPNKDDVKDVLQTLSREAEPHTIKDNRFYFFPSKINLSGATNPYEHFARVKDHEDCFKIIIESLKGWAKKKQIHFILIDCTAGYSIFSVPIIKQSNLVINVLEYDKISIKANKDLHIKQDKEATEAQVNILYLCNKININDTGTYDEQEERNSLIEEQQIQEKLSSKESDTIDKFTDIPPLPYDNKIRTSFAKCRYPLVEIGTEDSIFLMSIIPSMGVIFNSIKDKSICEIIKKYEIEYVARLYNKYREKIYVLDNNLNEINEVFKNLINTKNNENAKKLKKLLEDGNGNEYNNIGLKVKAIYRQYDQFLSFLLAYQYSQNQNQ